VKRIVSITMLAATLAACQATTETVPPTATALSGTGSTQPAPSKLSCAELGEMCGGVQGILCCGRLSCDYGPEPMYPDKSGVCIEDLRPTSEPVATPVPPTSTVVLQQALTAEGVILTVMEGTPVELSVEIRPGERYHVTLAQDAIISREGKPVGPQQLSPGMHVRIEGMWIPGGRQITAEAIDIVQ
jgi:hypothetical protein